MIPPIPRARQVPVDGGSGEYPTGAIQFRNDWPGLFIRGDSAISLVRYLRAFRELPLESLPQSLCGAGPEFERYVTIIERDVMLRDEDLQQ